MSTKKTVFVGLSGGVDSSVAALRLKKQGYTVVGVFIKVWHPEFMVCNWEQERLDAMRVAAHLDIPFLTCDAETAYKNGVADYFIKEYLAGRTPNPDVMCNQQVKFGHFMQFAKDRGADFIATGHYAERKEGRHGPELHRGVDANKDQTYFLWSLTNLQLASSLFPVGNSPKNVIRREAKKAGIPVATKQDSQGICFLGHVDIKDFLSHYVALVAGDVLDTAGTKIGQHSGALIYTLGQRHGFTINVGATMTKPHYVIAKDVDRNTITVSMELPHPNVPYTVTLSQAVLRSLVTPGENLSIQIRYRQTPVTATVQSVTKESVSLQVPAHTKVSASGQSCVLYRSNHCIGGGIIQ